MNESKTLVPAKLNGLAKKIQQHHVKCLEAFGTALRDAYECGRYLNEAKQSLPRGEYERWVHKSFDFGDRTAQMYKRIFENWSLLKSKAEDVASLSLSQANKLLTAPKPKPTQEGADDTSSPAPAVVTPPTEREKAAGSTPGTTTTSSPRSGPKTGAEPHGKLDALMKKFDLFGEPESLIRLLQALGFEKAEIDAKLAQG